MNYFQIRKAEDGVCRGVAPGVHLRSMDERSRTVEFVASDGSVDAYKTVLPPDKWDLSRFAKNPVISYQHQVYGGGGMAKADPDDVIGRGEAYVDGGQLRVRITFETADINPTADKIFRKILFGSINAVSVGFRPTRDGRFGRKEYGEDPSVFYYDGQELLEVSVVTIPANANAVKVQDGARATTGGAASLRLAKESAGRILASTPGTPEHAIAMARKALHQDR